MLHSVRTSLIPTSRKWVSFTTVIFLAFNATVINFRRKVVESIFDSFRNTIMTGKVKAHELRTKSKGELLTQLKELKEELSTVGL